MFVVVLTLLLDRISCLVIHEKQPFICCATTISTWRQTCLGRLLGAYKRSEALLADAEDVGCQ